MAPRCIDRSARSASDRQREPGIGEERPSGGMLGALQKRDGILGQSGVDQRGPEREFHDRLCRVQGVASDAEDGGVAAPEHAGRVGQDVRPPLEHERDDPARADDLLDDPALVLDPAGHLVTSRFQFRPLCKSGDHVPTHLVAGDEARGRAPLGLRAIDILHVDPGDLVPYRVVGEAACERIVEQRELLVRCALLVTECLKGAADGLGRQLVDGRGYVQYLAGLAHDDQLVTGPEPVRQFLRDVHDPVAADEYRHAGLESRQSGFIRHDEFLLDT